MDLQSSRIVPIPSDLSEQWNRSGNNGNTTKMFAHVCGTMIFCKLNTKESYLSKKDR